MDPTLTAYGLTHNPFLPGLPADAYASSEDIDHFVWRVERLARDGGFALVMGEPGTGKSTVMRRLEARLGQVADLRLGELTRPQCAVPDLYRELGSLFHVALSPHNRWAGTEVLRERWQSHIDAALRRPVLLIDEAQEMRPPVLNELRLLASTRLDSHILLTVVLAGDARLAEKLKTPELAPLASRIRVRLSVEPLTPPELRLRLEHLLAAAGNPALMTDGLIDTLSERAAGNLRTLAHLGAELLDAGMSRDAARLDEKLFLAVFATPDTAAGGRPARNGRRAR